MCGFQNSLERNKDTLLVWKIYRKKAESSLNLFVALVFLLLNRNESLSEVGFCAEMLFGVFWFVFLVGCFFLSKPLKVFYNIKYCKKKNLAFISVSPAF